ncbi:CNNM domain-containing protein [Ahrensia sp. R2A130]|uniref:CNNM domain-containing protein n=1 Tax=Ahrensia sp. R2A130 TaxID=744979 RepID=UPI0001E0D11A|nr:hemolysin family protein [Ahrensia sp. R2A130]EFL88871.1 CBS domain-containing protein [Ahrensia sp. R2A130]
MTLLVVYISIAVLASFLCSILEAVLLSVSPSYLGALKEKDPVLGKKMQALRDDIDRPLAAILTLNTIAHTIGAAGAGAQAAKVFGDASLTIFSIVLTLIILFASEIIPKTLGATYWKSLVPFVTRVLPPLIWVLYPLVWVSKFLSKLISGGKPKGAVTREEIAALADVGRQQGVLGEQHSRIVRNLLRFHTVTVEDVMTPRTVVHALDETTTVGDVIKDMDQMRFSRLPIYEGSIDNVTGIVLKNDILAAALRKETNVPVSTLKRDALRVSEKTSLEEFFATLLEESAHIAIITDEYGGMDGVATMEDVVETLLGLEIVDEADDTADMQVLARQQARDRAKRLGLAVDEASAGKPRPASPKITGS